MAICPLVEALVELRLRRGNAMQAWNELLSVKTSELDMSLGPQRQQIAAALRVIHEAEWLEHVGEPMPSYPGVRRVVSLDDALAIFDAKRVDKYDAAVNGHLIAPLEQLIEPVFYADPKYEMWYEAARDKARRITNLDAWVPDEVPEVFRERVWANLEDYVSRLLSEIVVSDQVDCTYFRELLPYYHAGHFPRRMGRGLARWPADSLLVQAEM